MTSISHEDQLVIICGFHRSVIRRTDEATQSQVRSRDTIWVPVARLTTEAAECNPLRSPSLAAACQLPNTCSTSDLHTPVSSCVKESFWLLLVLFLCRDEAGNHSAQYSLDVCRGVLLSVVNFGVGNWTHSLVHAKSALYDQDTPQYQYLLSLVAQSHQLQTVTYDPYTD